MCTFENERSVVVCDLAIGQVHEAVHAAFGDAVRCTSVTGLGTGVEAMSSTDKQAFQAVVHAAIAGDQKKSSMECGACDDASRTAFPKERT